jgi:hypothetical protein|tara:strand:+ start:68 stop:295 length:228 start_codon:yes stop_codon:yes gene_type:complete
MDQGILRTYDLNPDGVRVVINWEKMVVNASIFIPCINIEEALSQIKRITAEKGWGVETKILIEDEKLGLRVWRTT